MPRPLTPYEEKFYRDRGIDPTGFTVVDPQEQGQQGNSSAGGALVRSAASSALPSAGAGLAAAQGAAYGGAVAGPVGAIIGGIGAGLIGGMATGAVQGAVMPDAWKEQLTEDQKEHPWATTLGSAATLPLGGFNPSLDAVKGVNYLVRGGADVTKNLAGKTALINTGIGAGLGAVQEGVMEKMRGEDLQPGAIAEQALIGGVFNKVNRFGKAYGFHPDVAPNQALDKGFANTVGGTDAIPVTESGSQTVAPVGDKSADYMEQQRAAKLTTAQSTEPLPPKQGPEDIRFSLSSKNSYEANMARMRQKAGYTDLIKEQPMEEGLQDTSKLQTPSVADLQALLKERGLAGNVTPENYAAWADLFKQHGVEVKATAESGKGMYDPATQKAEARSSAMADTMPHELSHHIWTRLDNNTKVALTEQLMPEVNRINAEREAYNKTLKEGEQPMRMIDAEEYFASEMGIKAVQRVLQGENHGIKNDFLDLFAQLKTKYGSPKLGDIYRSALVDLFNGVPKETAIKGESRPGVARLQEGEEGLQQQKKDRTEYWAARRQQQAAELAAIRGERTDLTPQQRGERVHTMPEERAQLIPNVSEEQLKPVREAIKNTVGLILNKQTAHTGDRVYLSDANYKDVEAKVLNDLAANGIDSDGLEATAARRTATHLREMQDYIASQPHTSLDKEVQGRVHGGTTVGELVNPEAVKQQVAPEISIAKVPKTPAEKRVAKVKEPKPMIPVTEELPKAPEVHPEEHEGPEVAAPAKQVAQEPTAPTHTGGAISVAEWVERLQNRPQSKTPEVQGLIAKLKEMHPDTELDAYDVAELIGKKMQGEGEGLQPTQKYNYFKTKSELDVAEDKAGLEGKPVANALRNIWPVKAQLFGKYASPVLGMSKTIPEAIKTKVLNTLYRESADGAIYESQLTGKALEFYRAIRYAFKQNQQDKIDAGRTVIGMLANGKKFERPPQIDPSYFPSFMKASVLETLMERKPGFEKIKKDLEAYWRAKGADNEGIAARMHMIMSASERTATNQTHFGPNRLVEGLGLPAEYRDNNIDRVITRYFDRSALDSAWHQEVENKPEVMDLLKNDSIKHIFSGVVDGLKGEPYDKAESTIKGLNRLVTSLILGPLTNAHILGSTLAQGASTYLKGGEVASAYTSAIDHWSQSRKNAIQNGYLRGDVQSVKDIFDSGNTFTQRLAALSSTVGKVNGRQWSDVFAKTFAQAISEEIVPRRLADARGGDSYSQKLIRQLDPNWNTGKTYTPQELSQMASTLAGYIHGAHDARTLPGWMNKETIIKPFFSLMSWSVSQTNQWMKHVWEPAMKGNLQPLLMSTLGTVAGGYAIQQLRQLISDKKSNIPAIEEIANSSRGLSGNIPLLAYNFMQMASYTGFAGVGATLGKDLFDMAYKNMPQGSNFPLDEVIGQASNTLVKGIGAWMQTPDTDAFFRIFPRMMLDLAKENVQSARIAMNWAADTGMSTEKERYKFEVAKQENNLRKYKMTEGQPYSEQAAPGNNPYLNLQSKNFKITEDIGKAMGEVPGLIALARSRSQGNPEIFEEQLRGMKQNSYQTMPSIEHAPLQFSQYYNYLVRTQGQQAANEITQRYMQHNIMNKIKAGMLP